MATQPRWSDRYPELGNAPVPTNPYYDPEYFARERERLFKRAWLHVGRIEEAPEPGSFFVRSIPTIPASVIVAHGRDGVVRAFHNVCSHRCNRLVTVSNGKVRRFNCGYHGWSFDTEGRLAGVPQEANFHAIDKSKLGLTPIHAEVWEGFIFINFAETPQQSLADYLGPQIVNLSGYPFSDLTACFSWTAEIACNWKLALDAFSESYHVAYVHGRSIADALQAGAAPLDIKLNGLHRKLSMGANNSRSVYANPKAMTDATVALDVPDKPIEAAALRHGRRHAHPGGDRPLPPSLNEAKHANWIFDANIVFPDFYLSLRPNYVQAYNFRPITARRTLYEARVYYPAQDRAGGRFLQEYMKVMLRDVLLEDVGNLERQQRAIESGARPTMVLSDNEILIRHGLATVESFVRGEVA